MYFLGAWLGGMFCYKKGMAYKTTADSTSLYADAPANTLLNDVFCCFVHHLSKFQRPWWWSREQQPAIHPASPLQQASGSSLKDTWERELSRVSNQTQPALCVRDHARQ